MFYEIVSFFSSSESDGEILSGRGRGGDTNSMEITIGSELWHDEELFDIRNTAYEYYIGMVCICDTL